ncbi:MAG: NTP transferase domain-containing protein [Candidatus Omnitrophica bacterium]|nr:NTP transferase domain-containing protein [Candidatus Omnitrophota bacterium]MBI3021763.1 NTP transferase domain-containing protein [Candidatus Omnitrophota bacterium]
MTDVVILCGGRGTRLGRLTADTPKPLLPVGGGPFLLRRLTALRREGFSRFLLAAHYLAGQFHVFAEHYGRVVPGLEVIEEPKPLGTGGALRHAASLVRSPVFVALNGDSWMAQPAAPVLAAHGQGSRLMSMVVVRAGRVVGSRSAKGVVTFSPEGRLLGFSTGEAGMDAWVNSGLYVLDRAMVQGWPEGSYDLESHVSDLVPSGGFVFPSEGTFLDIGTPECYARAQQVWEGSEAVARR